MNENSRSRIIWGITALVVVYAIVSLVVYFTTGAFGQAWFVASLVVYGAVLVLALLMLAWDRRAREARPAADAPAPDPDVVKPVVVKVDDGGAADAERTSG